MNRTTFLQDRRMEKFEELLKRGHYGELADAEGESFLFVRTGSFCRYRRRYEDDARQRRSPGEAKAIEATGGDDRPRGRAPGPPG